jgi:hypothetical protein
MCVCTICMYVFMYVRMYDAFCVVTLVPVTTAWHVLRLRMGGWPPDMEVSFEHVE